MGKHSAPKNGVLFPAEVGKGGKPGKRRSTPTTKKVIGAFLRAGEDEGKAMAEALESDPSRKWRYGYIKHMLNVTRVIAAKTSFVDAAKACEAGLDAAYDAFRFQRKGGDETSLREAMEKPQRSFYATAVRGTAKPELPSAYAIPFGGKALEGDAILSAAREWASYGDAEPSFADGVEKFLSRRERIFDEVRKDCSKGGGTVFALLGATSEMGPMRRLLKMGATVVAVARGGEAKWKKLIKFAREETCGTLIVPTRTGASDGTSDGLVKVLDSDSDSDAGSAASDGELAKAAGCDCLAETPDVALWLSKLFPKARMVLGSYIYLDGEAFVRASVAMDAVARVVMNTRGASKCTLAYIDTPAHAHAVPRDCTEHAERLYGERGLAARIFSLAPSLPPYGKQLQKMRYEELPLYDGKDGSPPLSLCTGLFITPQGPNYAVAKFIQKWRAIVAIASGFAVSSNNGPPAKTDSVMHSPTIAKAMETMHLFEPNRVQLPETVEGFLTALLCSDVFSGESDAERKRRTKTELPLLIFQDQAWHGGGLRCAFTADSIAVSLVLLWYKERYGAIILAAVAAAAAAAAYHFLV